MGSRVVSEDQSDLDECSSVISKPETVHQYSKVDLRPRRKSLRNLTGGKTFSRAAKQGLPVLQKEDNIMHRFGSEKNALPVVLVSIMSEHLLLPSQRKRETILAGVELVISKQTKQVQQYVREIRNGL